MVYLLHYLAPYRHARHYLGTALDLDKRIEQHRNGTGARLPQVFAEHGIPFIVARTWEGGREVERRLKRRKNGPRLCPLCRAAKRNLPVNAIPNKEAHP